ncbi:MAG: hypothetical protein IT424_03600 [Pirellulales bacterium]|nr:hypothetical protein [Pirellulales bacterium]
MRVGHAAVLALAVGLAGPADRRAGGQSYQGYATQASAVQPVRRYEQKTGVNNPASSFFGAGKHAYYTQPATVPVPAPVPVQTAPTAKPFAQVYQQPTISPYLALDVRESDSAIPNYFMYVRPLLDQQRMNQAQQVQYRRLQQQVRRTSAAGAVTSANGGIPTTGHSAQFMNIGGYYPQAR